MDLYILGTGNAEAARVATCVRDSNSLYSQIYFLDNNKDLHGTRFFGFEVVGGYEVVPSISSENSHFVSVVSSSTQSRFQSIAELVELGAIIGNLIDPQVDLSLVQLGVGQFIEKNVEIQAGVIVGENSCIHTLAVIAHETIVGHTAFIGQHASILGKCVIGDGVFIGANSTILPRLRIGNWVTVGAGAVVTKDVEDFAIVAGVPARVVGSNRSKLTES